MLPSFLIYERRGSACDRRGISQGNWISRYLSLEYTIMGILCCARANEKKSRTTAATDKLKIIKRARAGVVRILIILNFI